MRSASIGVVALALSVLVGCSSTPDTSYKKNLTEAAKINLQLGVGYMRQGNYPVALKKLQKALDQNPDLAVAHNSIGVLYQLLGDQELAGGAFRRAIELAPRDTDALNNYARFLCMANRFDEAQDMFDRALANTLYETPEVTHTNAGVCLLQREKWVDAEVHFRKALRKNPRYSHALFQMARVRFRGGFFLSARAYIQRYLAISSHTAQSLWLGIQTERKLGDEDAVASYALLLRGKFPDSDETRELLESEKN